MIFNDDNDNDNKFAEDVFQAASLKLILLSSHGLI